MSVLQGRPKRSGWCGDATSGLLGRRSALFKSALQAFWRQHAGGRVPLISRPPSHAVPVPAALPFMWALSLHLGAVLL